MLEPSSDPGNGRGRIKSLKSGHSATLQLLSRQKAHQMGDHQDDNHDPDHLDQRIRDQRCLVDLSWLSLSPIGKTDGGERCGKKKKCEKQGHIDGRVPQGINVILMTCRSGTTWSRRAGGTPGSSLGLITGFTSARCPSALFRSGP